MKSVITTPDVQVVIDYAGSALKNRSALIYLTNVDVPNTSFNMLGVDEIEIFGLIDSYITHKSTINIESLVMSVMLILMCVRSVHLSEVDRQTIQQQSLITEDQVVAYLSDVTRSDNLLHLIHVLDNIPTFISSCSTEFIAEYGEPVEAFQCVDDVNYTGFTLVNLLSSDVFTINYYSAAVTSPQAFFIQQFTEYLFSGRNLFSYLSNTFMLPALHIVASSQVSHDQLTQAVAEANIILMDDKQ
jgi:hypothetical protein